MKTFKGKAIYNPTGKAGEYAKWACNFYVGCSNGCEYCYCKKGMLAGTMGGDTPRLKKCFRDEGHALEVFEKELVQNLHELQKHGLFFSFTTDPMLPDTIWLTHRAVELCNNLGVPIKVLTKCTGWVDDIINEANNLEGIDGTQNWRKDYAFGFTLTGHDEFEPGASTNAERIEAMKKLHNAGFKTFASIEPIIDFESSYRMIEQSAGFCDLYKIGLKSGLIVTSEVKKQIMDFSIRVQSLARVYNLKIYWKDSILKHIPAIDLHSAVGRDYNLFK